MTDTNFAHYVDQSSLLIDGKLIPAERGRTFTSINPPTEEVIGSAPDAALAASARADISVASPRAGGGLRPGPRWVPALRGARRGGCPPGIRRHELVARSRL